MSANNAIVAAEVESAIVRLDTVYVMIWRYLHLVGKIEEPMMTGVKRIAMLAIILGGALHLWLYNELIVDTFFNAPGQLVANVIGAYDSVTIIDQIIFAGDDAATLLIQKGGFLNGNFSYYVAGFAVYLIVGLTYLHDIPTRTFAH